MSANRYLVGAYALGAQVVIGGPNEDAAALATALNRRQNTVPSEPESGISLGGVALLVGAIGVALATWPRVSRWFGG